MAPPEVQVRGALEFPFWVIPKNKRNELNVRAVVRIEAPVLETRASIDLVVVLDVAAGQSSMLDTLKKALRSIITRNLDDGDCLAIVASGNDGWYPSDLIKISRTGRRSAQQQVDAIVAVGHSAPKSGLQQAFKVLDGRSKKERQGFIIFVSDRSEKSDDLKWGTGDLALRKYPIHTLGLGELHDPTELLLIANESNGTYSSITKNSNNIMEALAVRLALFKSVVAVDVSVEITHKQTSMETEIPHFWGFSRPTSNNKKKVRGGVLYAGEVKHLIIDITKCTLDKTSGFDSFELLTATAKYKHAAQGKQPNSTTTVKVECNLEVSVCATSFAARCTRHYSTNPSPMFLHQMVRINVLDKFIASFLEECQNTRNKAESSSSANHEDPALVLVRTWKDFKASDESWQEAWRIGLDLQLQRIESDIDAMVSGLKQGLGVACVYSWQSSHKMQRAATTDCLALTTNASFLTPAIEDMVKAQQEQSKKQGAGSSSTGNPPHPAPPPAGKGKEGALAPASDDPPPPPHPAPEKQLQLTSPAALAPRHEEQAQKKKALQDAEEDGRPKGTGKKKKKAQHEQSKDQGAGSSTDNTTCHPTPPAGEGVAAAAPAPAPVGDNPSRDLAPPSPADQLADSTPATKNPSHDPASPPGERVATTAPAGSDDCKQRAVQLLDGIRERFEGWCNKLDHGVPLPVFEPSSAEESAISTDLTTVLHKDIIRRAMQHDLYLAAVDAVNQWCNSSSGCGAQQQQAPVCHCQQRVNLEQSGNKAESVDHRDCYLS